MKKCSNHSGDKFFPRPEFTAIFLFGILFLSRLAQGQAAGLYLVGLGPGDPDLATVRALKLIQSADLIYAFGGDILERFADYLKDKEVRELPQEVFLRYNVRRSGPGDSGPKKERQTFLNSVRRDVKSGKQVVFIDNGDPLISGPWVWMLKEFEDIGIEVVPGISSFNAGLAAIGRDPTWAPDTHSVILTSDRPQSRDRLEVLAALQCSMAIFTHRSKFEDIIRKLKSQYPPATPISIVLYAGFKDKQAVIEGTLETIESKVQPDALPFENIILLGDFITGITPGVSR
ncbi:MAG: tetrapyrrole methylase [Acidobacteria bacterium]|nr:tetrapyrrole methylase [Acidobacteriota bacterium]